MLVVLYTKESGRMTSSMVMVHIDMLMVGSTLVILYQICFTGWALSGMLTELFIMTANGEMMSPTQRYELHNNLSSTEVIIAYISFCRVSCVIAKQWCGRSSYFREDATLSLLQAPMIWYKYTEYFAKLRWLSIYHQW